MTIIDMMTPGKKFTLEQVRRYVHANGIQPVKMDTVARQVLRAYRKGEQATLRESFTAWRNASEKVETGMELTDKQVERNS
jgi:hypothetical protein